MNATTIHSIHYKIDDVATDFQPACDSIMWLICRQFTQWKKRQISMRKTHFRYFTPSLSAFCRLSFDPLSRQPLSSFESWIAKMRCLIAGWKCVNDRDISKLLLRQLTKLNRSEWEEKSNLTSYVHYPLCMSRLEGWRWAKKREPKGLCIFLSNRMA